MTCVTRFDRYRGFLTCDFLVDVGALPRAPAELHEMPFPGDDRGALAV